jgi:hypothetical protein
MPEKESARSSPRNEYTEGRGVPAAPAPTASTLFLPLLSIAGIMEENAITADEDGPQEACQCLKMVEGYIPLDTVFSITVGITEYYDAGGEVLTSSKPHKRGTRDAHAGRIKTSMNMHMPHLH